MFAPLTPSPVLPIFRVSTTDAPWEESDSERPLGAVFLYAFGEIGSGQIAFQKKHNGKDLKPIHRHLITPHVDIATSMKNWPRPVFYPRYLPSYLIEFSDGSFAKPTKKLWRCRARCSTEALFEVLRTLLKDKRIEPTKQFDYRVWHLTKENKKGPEMTSVIQEKVVRDFVELQQPAAPSQLEQFTVFWTFMMNSDPLYWMTVEARSPTEAFLISHGASIEFGVLPNNRKSQLNIGVYDNVRAFSIYRGWHKPLALYGDVEKVRLPSVFMSEPCYEPRLKEPKRELATSSSMYTDVSNTDPEGGSPDGSIDEHARISRSHSDVANEVNIELLEFLFRLDNYDYVINAHHFVEPHGSGDGQNNEWLHDV